jgi:hypothetical protein
MILPSSRITTMQEFQTRSDDPYGKWSGLNFFSSFDTAYKASQEDASIWKISYAHNEKDYRWVRKHKSFSWPNSEKRLCEMSQAYNEAKPNDVFWVNQCILHENYDVLYERRKEEHWTEEQWDAFYLPLCIRDVLTDSEFEKLFSEK